MLTPVEFLVYQQLASPNQPALALAKARRSPLTVEHLAEGVGIPIGEFNSITNDITTKLQILMSTTTTETASQANAAASTRIGTSLASG